MDQDPSSKDKNQEQRTKNQEPKTIVLRPLKENQGFRIQGPRSSRKIKIRTPSQEQELKGPKYLQREQDREQARTKIMVP